ncbi:WbqC family protein [uncultured Dokdonia sp.]|uniref:WbqC family protein n=1 Tax=uncultured Dokdonia sp. TaxID=575653 RepID=UPI002630475C|nr:WbqC family protein [uncultured Dokdonia sp.]
MKTILIHPGYCLPIVHYACIAQADTVIFEALDNYQKQSYRSRTKIATASGMLQLTIPIKHNRGAKSHQLTFEVKLENKFHWQRDHWRSLKVAYQTSPFFEYYEDTFEPLFTTVYDTLIAFNLACHECIMECLQLEKEGIYTEEYFRNPSPPITNLRHLITSKKEPDYMLPEYHQLFHDKHGYLPNLSILDLLFNEGPNALTYLENVDLSNVLP